MGNCTTVIQDCNTHSCPGPGETELDFLSCVHIKAVLYWLSEWLEPNYEVKVNEPESSLAATKLRPPPSSQILDLELGNMKFSFLA